MLFKMLDFLTIEAFFSNSCLSFRFQLFIISRPLKPEVKFTVKLHPRLSKVTINVWTLDFFPLHWCRITFVNFCAWVEMFDFF